MKIVIVGGGSSGWLVASGLIRYCPNYEISVIESANIPTIGVGESTTAYVKHFIKDCLKIDESHFLKETNGIYKMSVKFKNFSKNNMEGFHYPFGMPNVEIFKESYINAWDLVKTLNKDVKHEDFVKILYPAFYLFSKNKIDKNLNNEFDNFDFNTDLGYHFDANRVGEYLKNNYCVPKGVKHIVGNVGDINFLNDEVNYLILESGEKVYGDLFIDCTGFKSILLGQRMKPKFIDASDKLLNNKAWATPTQYDDIYFQMQPYTTATALNNGWAWYTPIASRIGNGYAYSEKFINSENALGEFKDYLLNSENYNLTKEQIEDLPFFEIAMKIGFYEKSMIKNVVGIGLSSGFLEPLEGTGLHFVIEQLYSLIKIIENGKPNQFLIDSFNLSTKDLYETWIDTLLFIYLSSRKDDSDYWKHINNLEVINLDLKNKKHIHEINDYAYRLHHWNRHNYENDLFNNVLRGSGLINNFNELDADIYSMYQKKKNIDIKNIYNKYSAVMNQNIEKWERNSRDSLHIYDFLKQEDAIKY
jgi:flavin-dependent dehydrogenase